MTRGPATHALTRHIFLRALGLVFVVAFLSFYAQFPGILGVDGLQPASEYLDAWEETEFGTPFTLVAYHAALGLDVDAAVELVCIAGFAISMAMVCGHSNSVVVACAWALYLSLCTVGQDFFAGLRRRRPA